MDWSKGYTATYYMKKIDPDTWRDLEPVEITAGSISREDTGLRESANITTVNTEIDPVEQWVRVYLDTDQKGDGTHTPLFTGLATTPGDDYEAAYHKNELDCYSVLKPAEDVALLRGWYASTSTPAGEIIKQLLHSTPAPVHIAENSPILTTYIVAEDNETSLSMTDKILDAIGWRMRINGLGEIYIEPKPTEAEVRFSPIDFDVIEDEIQAKADYFACPNVVLAIDDDLSAIARDDSIDSPLSTINRGREVWLQESNCDYGENESLAEFAERRLSEAQRVYQKANYNRRYIPELTPGDLVELVYPAQGLTGLYKVSSQSVELAHAARTAEEVTSEV